MPSKKKPSEIKQTLKDSIAKARKRLEKVTKSEAEAKTTRKAHKKLKRAQRALKRHTALQESQEPKKKKKD